MTHRGAFAAALVVVALASACSSGTTDDPSPTPSPSATSPPLGAKEIGGNAEKGSARCGEYLVEWRSPGAGGEGARASLVARKGAELVLGLSGNDNFESLEGWWCGDITGDGTIELASQRFTAGASCCTRFRIDTLGGDTLLDVDLGRVAGPLAEQLDGEGALEVTTHSDMLYFVGDLPASVSPSLPRYFAFRGGKYEDATTDLKDAIRRRGDFGGAQIDLSRTLSNTDDENAIKGSAMRLFGLYVLLGEEKVGLEKVAKGLPPNVEQWLRDHADEAIEAIKNPTPPGATASPSDS